MRGKGGERGGCWRKGEEGKTMRGYEPGLRRGGSTVRHAPRHCAVHTVTPLKQEAANLLGQKKVVRRGKG